jgi:hypothetical protein
MRKIQKFTLATAAAVSMVPVATGSVHAKILCDGPYQLSGGHSIPTPYCEDNYLAAVARSYGHGVSGSEIRYNYNAKKRVCQWIGHDTRVSQICIGARPEVGKRLWTP